MLINFHVKQKVITLHCDPKQSLSTPQITSCHMGKITWSACFVLITSPARPCTFHHNIRQVRHHGFHGCHKGMPPLKTVPMVTVLVRCQEWLAVFLDTPSYYTSAPLTFKITFLICRTPSIPLTSLTPTSLHILPSFLPSFLPPSLPSLNFPSPSLPLSLSPSSSFSPSLPNLHTNNSCDYHVTLTHSQASHLSWAAHSAWSSWSDNKPLYSTRAGRL